MPFLNGNTRAILTDLFVFISLKKPSILSTVARSIFRALIIVLNQSIFMGESISILAIIFALSFELTSDLFLIDRKKSFLSSFEGSLTKSNDSIAFKIVVL